MINKIVQSIAEALSGIRDGATVLMGGFGAVGQPDELIEGLIEQGAKDLVVVANNAGAGRVGLAKLMEAGRVRKIICSFPRSAGSVVFEELYRAGKLELEIVPQGTLAERMRAAGAGIAAFYTPTGAGTAISDGGLPLRYAADGSVAKASPKKETREFNGRLYVLEPAITGDFAIVKAWKADRFGNLVYRHTAMNFNPMCATAAKVTIAEVEEIASVGELDPDHIHTPGIFVQRVIQGGNFEKRIERRTVSR